MNDLNLLYSGGSGGFLLLHLLLLSNKFHAEFEVPYSLDEIINKQWNIVSDKQWKSNEFWPNNNSTANASSNLRKIYFYNNPERFPLENFLNNKLNLVVYTDFVSQRKLAFYKRAKWFCNQNNSLALDDKFSESLDLLRSWKKHYNNIKDPSWPLCSSFRKISKLPDNIQKELLSNEHTNYYLTYQFKNNRAEFYGDLVYKNMLPFLETAEVVIKLQDLVNSQGTVLVDLKLIPEINTKQIALLDHWKSLHPLKLLDDIGIY